MSEKVKNTIVVLEPSSKSAQELLALLAEKDVANIVKVATPDEALQNIVSNLPCMFVACINDNQDVPLRIQLFKRLEMAIKHHGLKIYVVTPIKNRQLADLITQKMGVQDFIVEPVPVRTMQFKANLQLKAVDNFRRQQEMKKAAEEKVVIKKLDNAKKVETAGAEVKTNGKPALQAGEDTFLFKNSGVRKAGKKFTVELEGPDPSTGDWVEHEDKGDAQTSWRWVPNDEKEKQAKGEKPKDGWVHKGDKPLFNEESGKWAMSSEKPSLALMNDGRAVASKMGVDETGDVFVADDSPAAEENLKKNKVKAAAEKKKREESRKSAKELLGGDDEDDDNAKLLGAGGEVQGKPADRKTKSGAPGEKSSALNSLLGGDDDDANAGEVNDLRDPKANDAPRAVKDMRSPTARKLDDLAGDGDRTGETGESEGQDAGPMAFLQKQKEARQRDEVAKIQRDPAAKGVTDLTGDSNEEPGRASDPVDRRRKSNSSALDRLARSLDATGDGSSEDTEEPSPPGGDGEEGGEGEAGSAGPGGRPSMKVGDGKKDPKAKKLRDDPASLRSDVNDRQSQGAAARALELRDERSRTSDKLKGLLESPIPDRLDAAEEEAMRSALNLKERPDIKPKEVARKHRLKNVKELKDRLAEIENELNSAEEEAKGESVSSAGLAEEEAKPEPRRGDLSRDKLKGITGAFDGEEAVAEREEENRKRLKDKHEERKRKAGNQDRAEYMPQADLQPLGNAWESADGHYVYLDAKVRYKGFAKLEDLLPLWIFEGDDVPQLLDKTKQWRFLGGRPFQARTVGEIPSPVRDFLIGLRDQLLRAAGEEVPERDDQDTPDRNAGEPEAERDSDGEDADETGDPAAKDAPKTKQKDKRAANPGAGFEGLLGDEEDAEAPEAGLDSELDAEEDAAPEASGDEDADAGKPRSKRGAEDGAEGSQDQQVEKRARQNKARAERLGAQAKALLEEAEEERGQEEPAEEPEAESEADSSAAKMARLRAKLGMTEEGDDAETGKARASRTGAEAEGGDASDEANDGEGSDTEANSEDSPRAKTKRASVTAGDSGAERGNESNSSAEADKPMGGDAMSVLSSSKSEGIQKFLERRKKKLEEALPSTGSGNAAESAPPAAKPRTEPQAGYLGIYVAVSDAYANFSEPTASLRRILTSIEGSFKDCVAIVTATPDSGGSAEVFLQSSVAPAPVTRITLADGLSEPIQRSHGGGDQILGYLFLGVSGQRRGFAPAEEATIRRLAAKIWPLVLQARQSAERKAA